MTLEMDRKGSVLYYINPSLNNKKVCTGVEGTIFIILPILY